MRQRGQRVIMETARHRIIGNLLLPSEGYRSRMTDFLSAPDSAFLALTDVEVEPLNGDGPALRRGYVALSRAHVVLAMLAEEEGDASSEEGG
jgi:hypothetical protein